MRIAHVVGSLDPHCGGPPVLVVGLAAEQARQKHQVRIISCASQNGRQRIDALIGSIPGAGLVEYTAIPAPGPIEQILTTATRQSVRPYLAEIDVVHLHGVWDPILRATAAEAYQERVPYAIAPQGMLDPWSLAQKHFKKAMALRLGYRSMLNRAAFLQLLHRDEKQMLRPLRLTTAVEIVPNGIATAVFMDLPPVGDFRVRYPKIADSPYIMFLGRLHYKKGLDILAAAFAAIATKHPNARLVVAGHDEGARPAFEAQIASVGLQSRVHLIGPISGREKLAALVDAACFCLPSRQEGFSIAVLEAMACARPVVISEECHFPEVAEANAGVVVPLEASAIARALDKILCDPELGNRMGQAGRAMVFDRFTWAAASGMLIAAYERAAKK
jgi:glycosyltransferase involved in cell wall biosynthesis